MATDALAASLARLTGRDHLAFFDAAAPIVMADSLDRSKVFSQSRYEDGGGDYLNAPWSKGEYDAFARALVGAERVIRRDFESKDLFQACQPIEEVARAGHDAPRFGASSRWASSTRARGGVPGRRCSCAPRTRPAKATTWWGSRPTSPSPSSGASSA